MTKVILTRRVRSYRGYIVAAGLLLLLGGLTAGGSYILDASNRLAQLQTDPNVATVWIMGVTYGPQHRLTRGTLLQKWLNSHGVHAMGDYRVLNGKFGSDPGSLEIWFDYQSHLPAIKELECHRTGETAFVDDMGQEYHGFLDFQGKYIGVYLPGYDHAAKRIVCSLHWMPRQPGRLRPISEPMFFTVDLPPAKRVLPSAASLPRGPISLTNQGVTVTVSEARLGRPKLDAFYGGQRDLTFRLKIQGGEVANSNVDTVFGTTGAVRIRWRRGVFGSNGYYNGPNLLFPRPGSGSNLRINPSLSGPIVLPNRIAGSGVQSRFTLTDPYGISLMPGEGSLSMLYEDSAAPLQNTNGTIWTAPVNGAGRGTDAARLHFDVLPTGALPGAKPIPFDITVPVLTDEEV